MYHSILEIEQSIKNLRVNTDMNEKDFNQNLHKNNNKFEKIQIIDTINIDGSDSEKEDSVNFAEDFKNLEKLDSDKLNKSYSLDLGSAYNQNDYQFDDKVSSVQRDLSLDN